MRVKICGITQPEQGEAIATLGATAIGFICVPTSPRYVCNSQIEQIVNKLPENIDKIGVFANSTPEAITHTVLQTGMTAVQLHGEETPEFCQQLRQLLPQTEIIKALRIRHGEDIAKTDTYHLCVNTLLLDAYHPQQLGGTGKTLDWRTLEEFRPPLPWFLAGGLTPDNILDALAQVQPDGIDLSSGVERSPGDKDLQKVEKLFEKLAVL
ncbi:phosphoribosylanthranilate isomerase [Calothrix sp. 336/3]|uniref:phosphoribosylanthranilate isomerase n=1 Tax=Calothrix sp. 336/3 TaxID=1337936 RepID=UPI0004E2F84C|nr:phosphoribosylanthranilate isomerase [Calothrix sp. 336/3]AKG21150.1 N-(5'-phosphoribosyl)anthranilate isomerase [Calothrix sp. 336/3]